MIRYKSILTFPRAMTWAEYIQKTGPLSLEMTLYLLGEINWSLRVKERAGKPLDMPGYHNVRVVPGARAYIAARGRVPAEAPELLQGSSPGAWTVVYQLAALIYQALTGEKLPSAMARSEDDSEVQQKLIALTLKEEEKMALRRALALELAARTTSVSDFLDALGEIPDPPGAGTARGKSRTSFAKPVRGRKGWIILAVSAVVLLILGTGMGYYALMRDRYAKAARCIAEYDFRKAKEYISSVPDWISADARQIRDLAEAGILYEIGDFDQAGAQLERLGSFMVSPVLLEKTQAALAEDALTTLVEEITGLLRQSRTAEAWERLHQALAAQQSASWKDALAEQYARLIVQWEEPLTILKELEPYTDRKAFKNLRTELIPGIYDRGEAAFQQGDMETARDCLMAVGIYKKAKTYLKVMTSTDPEVLIPYRKNPAICKRLHSTEVLETFLRGSWAGGGFTLEMDEGKNLTTDIPWGDLEAEYYEITDGVVIQSNDEESQRCFTLQVEGKNTLKVYSHVLDRTITMRRKS